MAPQVEPKGGIQGEGCGDMVCEENCRLLNSGRGKYNIIVGNSGPFFVFFINFTIFEPL